MDILERKKLGHFDQIISAYNVKLEGGRESGKQCILATNHKVQLLISKDNCLDILYLKYGGINISFMSANGINSSGREFDGMFEGGFLYTCGLENIGRLHPEKLTHGSIHGVKADNVIINIEDEKIIISGNIKDTMLFNRIVNIKRTIEIAKDYFTLEDNIINEGYTDADYLLLYHYNFGYPFLDKGLEITADSENCQGLSEKARKNAADAWSITDPEDGFIEDVYYHKLSKGDITLSNNTVGISVNMKYDINALPYLIEWKSMQSGAYALGIEPSVSRFDNLTPVILKSGESKQYRFTFNFSQI
jgi:hypothetical protein